MTQPRYIARPIFDGQDSDGVLRGHYVDTRLDEVARDYNTLTVADFDAKYPGWADDPTFKSELRWEFRRQERVRSMTGQTTHVRGGAR